MAFIDDVVVLLSKISNYIRLANTSGEMSKTETEMLIDKLVAVKRELKDSESRITQILEEKTKQIKNNDGTVYVFSNGEVKAVLSKDIEKPRIEVCEKLGENCNCQLEQNQTFDEFKKLVVIEDERELVRMDSELTCVALEVFDHSYRTYQPFSCWIGIYTITGNIFIIDMLKFRKMISRLNLLRCNVIKYVHCEKCIEILRNEYGGIGCYVNYSAFEMDRYVDYRIRPINQIFTNIMQESLFRTVEKINLNIVVNKHIPDQSNDLPENKLQEFKSRNGINFQIAFLDKLFAYRDYLAKQDNESPEYILSDNQMIQLLEKTPLTISEFTELFARMSPNIRTHATDILIIMRKKHDFSVKNLMVAVQEEVIPEQLERYRAFGTPGNAQDEEPSSFEISDVE